MIADGVEDEEKWLAAGIAGLQQNAFYMHRALVTIFSSLIVCFSRKQWKICYNFSGVSELTCLKP